MQHINEDKRFVEIYAELSEKTRVDIPLRRIEGSAFLKRKYVSEAIKGIDCRGYQDIIRTYFKHREYAIAKRLCCADCINIFNMFLKDGESQIRLKCVNLVEYRDKLDLSDRILDVDADVRKRMYVIYKEGYNLIYSNENKENHIRDVEPDGEFMEYILNLFKGCLTTHKEEYMNLLKECPLPFDLLYGIRDKKGVKDFLKSMKVGGYSLLGADAEKKRFFFKYFCDKKLEEKHVYALLEEDILSGINYLKRMKIAESKYFEFILNRMWSIEEDDTLRKVVKYLEEAKKENEFLENVALEDILPEGDVVECHPSHELEKGVPYHKNIYFILSLINKVPEHLIYGALKCEPSLSVSLFLSKYVEKSREILERICAYKGDRIVDVVLRGNGEILKRYVFILLKRGISEKDRKKLVRNRSVVGVLSYFYGCGMVGIKRRDFFIESIVLLCRGVVYHEEEGDGIDSVHDILQRIRVIYLKYLSRVDKVTRNMFYTLSLKMKRRSLYKSDVEYEVENGILRKESVPLIDKLLYFICDCILEDIKDGAVMECEEDYNGFRNVREEYVNTIFFEKFNEGW
jgi:hypothetical protein